MQLDIAASEAFIKMLDQLLQTEPSKVSQLLEEFGYSGKTYLNSEAIVCIARIEGNAFTDELFILYNALPKAQSNQVQRFAAFTGAAQFPKVEGLNLAQKKKIWDTGLGVLTDLVSIGGTVAEVVNGIKNPKETEDSAPYDYQINPPATEKKKYLGLTQPVFFGGISVLVLLLVFLAVRNLK